MKNKVIVFGLLDSASLAHFYLTNDSEYDVVAFTVHQDYFKQKEFRGLPVLPFEDIHNTHPPDDYYLFCPMFYKKMNTLRKNVYIEGKAKGYEFITYVSSKATTFPGNAVGDNCFILEDNTIQPFTEIGNNVVLWSGNHIGHHSVIKDHNFITSHVVVSGHCIIEPHCFLGVNSTIRDMIHVAEGSLLGMHSSLVKNTVPWGVYVGSPAVKKKDVHSMDVL